MRLFVAVVPPAAVLGTLEALPRPEREGVRWTAPEHWHVTLRFLGEVPDGDDVAVVAALDGVRAPVATASLGPTTSVLGSGVLVVPVAGLDAVAAAVVDGTRHVGRPPEPRPFRGHLTLARCRDSGARGRGHRQARRLAGAPVAGTWTVEHIVLVRSRLSGVGPRYEVLHRTGLGDVAGG